MTADVEPLLRAKGIQPSVQRVEIARYVLFTKDHPSADEVYDRIRRALRVASRATVYNTLHLFVKKGLLKEITVAEGPARYDPHVRPHHHLVDLESGRLVDVPWNALEVRGVEGLGRIAAGLEVVDYEVIVRGKRRGPRPSQG